MLPEKLVQKILALGDAWRVVRMDYKEKEQPILNRVGEAPALWKLEPRPHCGHKIVRGYDHTPQRRRPHRKAYQLQLGILCALPREECQGRGKIYTVRADAMNLKKKHNYLTAFLDLQGKRVLLDVEANCAMRLELQTAYAAGILSQGHRRFGSWCRWARTEAEPLTSRLLAPMYRAADMVEWHLEGILPHWRQGLTTAFLEGLNSLFSAVKRKAAANRSTEYQTAMLYFVAGKLEIPDYPRLPTKSVKKTSIANQST